MKCRILHCCGLIERKSAVRLSSVQFTHARPNYAATMSLSKECHPNGVRKTRKVLRSEADFRRASEYVAAIDFGTTYCSLAYTLRGTTEILKMQLNGHHMRVPNAILIEKESNEVVAFGYYAQARFSGLQKTDQKKYIYFERMKMILYRSPVSPMYIQYRALLLMQRLIVRKFLWKSVIRILQPCGL